MGNKPLTVLLVEDDLNDVFLVKRAFKLGLIQNPLQVVTDGQEALNYLQGQGKFANRQEFPMPGLVVMDLTMPRMSGFEVLEAVRADDRLRPLPIVIVSASDNPADINRGYRLGANAYMVKPMDSRGVEHLFQSITHYWGLQCAKPELERA